MKTELSGDASPVLSFCIPTYNRSAALVPLVKRLLQTPSADIEVVVLDNGSTDGTLAQLATIDDPRLVVRSNGTNLGVIFNVVNVLVQGSGRYSVLLLDKDTVDPVLVPDFVEFLHREEPACGLCEYNDRTGRLPQIFTRGEAALCGLAYSCHHPTGYFFRTSDLREIDIVGRFTNFDHVGHFPFEFMQAELCLNGHAGIYHAPIFAPESLASAAQTRSFGTNAANEDAFFSPKGRLLTTVHFSRHICGLPVSAAVKQQLILDRIAKGMFGATVGYRRLMHNREICTHYHITPRKIGVVELVHNGFLYYRSFFQAYPDGRVGADVQLSHANIAADWMCRFAQGIWRRIARKSA